MEWKGANKPSGFPHEGEVAKPGPYLSHPYPPAVIPALVVTTSTSNFEFLHDEFPALYAIGKEAEFLLHHDPAAALSKLRLFDEKLVNPLFEDHRLLHLTTAHAVSFDFSTPSFWGHFFDKQERGLQCPVLYPIQRV